MREAPVLGVAALGRLLAAGACVVAGAGCSPAATPPGADTHETSGTQAATEVDVDLPRSALADEPLGLQVTGAGAGEQVQVTLRRPGTGPGTESALRYLVGDDGTLDLTEDEPIDGYAGASGYGPLWTLRGGLPPSPEFVTLQLQVDVTVGDGTGARFTQVRRVRSRGVRVRSLTVPGDGLRGYFFRPRGADAGRPRPAVLVFGGAEGGLAPLVEAQLLASRGYPTLLLAYFDAPGVPKQLRRIPLEYFTDALEWLADQRGVDPDRLVPYGLSRGGEAALLVASLRPDLTAGAIALAPSGVVTHAPLRAYTPAWTWHGRPLPYVSTSRQMDRDPGRAVIKVWRIDGPLLLIAGRADRVWPSAHQIEDIQDRLADHHRPPATVALYEDVGHEIGFLPPGVAVSGGLVGTDPDATGHARADGWQQVLDHLQNLRRR